jgi:hypothetical protein
MQNDVNARMNWFERHLNWTAVGMGVGSAGLFLLLIWISFGFQFPYWHDMVGYSLPVLIVLGTLAVAWLLLPAFGYGWILYRKNRNPVFLFLFTPCLLMVAGTLIYKMFFHSNIIYNDAIVNGIIDYWPDFHEFQIAFGGILLFSLCWFILLVLRNRNLATPEIENRVSIPDNKLWQQLYIGQKRTIVNLFAISVLNIALLVFTVFFINFSFLTYHSPVKEGFIIPSISFKYPANADEPEYYHTRVFSSGYPSSKDFQYNDHISVYRSSKGYTDYYLSIFFPLNVTDTESAILSSDNFSEMLLQQYNNPPEYQQITENEIMVDNVLAHQMTIFVENKHNYVDDNDIGTNSYVYFMYKNKLWVISYHAWLDTERLPSPAFTHLLETFKIYDE